MEMIAWYYQLSCLRSLSKTGMIDAYIPQNVKTVFHTLTINLPGNSLAAYHKTDSIDKRYVTNCKKARVTLFFKRFTAGVTQNRLKIYQVT
jgi:hypothetical protein